MGMQAGEGAYFLCSCQSKLSVRDGTYWFEDGKPFAEGHHVDDVQILPDLARQMMTMGGSPDQVSFERAREVVGVHSTRAVDI